MLHGKTALQWYQTAAKYMAEIKKRDGEIIKLKKELSAIRAELKQATESLSKQRQENERLTTKLNDKQDELDTQIDLYTELEGAVRELENKLDESERSNKALLKANKRLQAEVDAGNGQLTAIEHIVHGIKKLIRKV